MKPLNADDTIAAPDIHIAFRGFSLIDVLCQAHAFVESGKPLIEAANGGQRPVQDLLDEVTERLRTEGFCVRVEESGEEAPVEDRDPVLDELHPSTRAVTAIGRALAEMQKANNGAGGEEDDAEEAPPPPVEALRQMRLSEVAALGRARIAGTKGAGNKVLTEMDNWLGAYGLQWAEPEEAESEETPAATPAAAPAETAEEPEPEPKPELTFEEVMAKLRELLKTAPDAAKEIGSAAIRATGEAVPNANQLPPSKRGVWMAKAIELLNERGLL